MTREVLHEAGVWGGLAVDMERVLEGVSKSRQWVFERKMEGWTNEEIGGMVGRSREWARRELRAVTGQMVSLLGAWY